MTNTIILSFQDTLKIASGQKRHLLLGNGFSMDLFKKIFSYRSLFEKTDFSKMPESKKVFDILSTNDFEEVISALKTSAKILPAFQKSAALIYSINNQANMLKKLLIQAISDNHPSNPGEITQLQLDSCKKFLSNFISKSLPNNLVGIVYTFNYDLLLYWVIIDDIKSKIGSTLHADDGFRTSQEDPVAEYVTWNDSSNNPNIRFLHGALHLFDDGINLKKFCWERKGVSLVEQIKDALNKDEYPLFVSEGTSIEKLKKIRHSHISLQSALKSFSKIGGNLFIHGHSLADNDDHVINLIPKSKINKVFIGIYGDPNKRTNKAIIKKAKQLPEKRIRKKDELKIYFYDSSTANVWDGEQTQTDFI